MKHEIWQRIKTDVTRWWYGIDSELLVRIERLRSGIKQARDRIQFEGTADKNKVEAELNEMEESLKSALALRTPHDQRITLVVRTNAELCLYEPAELLEADRIRLEDRLFRLKEEPRKKWKDCLAKYGDKSDDHGVNQYRQLLRQLSFELAESAESFNRAAAQRARALFWLGLTTLVILAILVSSLICELTTLTVIPVEDGLGAYLLLSPKSLLLAVLLAGSIGATITTVSSLILEEKLRAGSSWVILLNIVIRIAFGSIYAIVVVFALLSENILPVIKIGTGLHALMTTIVVAFVAGTSDKLFGQVVGRVIEGKGQKKEDK